MTTKKNFALILVSIIALLLTALGITFIPFEKDAQAAIDWTGHSYTKFTPYSNGSEGREVYSPIDHYVYLCYRYLLTDASIIGETNYNGGDDDEEYIHTPSGSVCLPDGITHEGSEHQGTNTGYDTRYRIEIFTNPNVYVRQGRIAPKNSSGFYVVDSYDYGINSTTTSFKFGKVIGSSERDSYFGTVGGSGAYDINMLYDIVLVYEYFINGNSVRVSAGSVADELSGGLTAETTVNPANYEREGYVLEGFWSGEDKTGIQVLDEKGYFVNDYAYTPGATLYPGYTQAFYFDINNTLDGKDNEASQYFTFSLDVDGETVAQNVNDFYQPIGVGHSIEVYDIKCVDGYSFAGYNASNSSAVNSSSTSSHIYVTMPEEEMVITLNFMSGAFWTDEYVQTKLGVDFDNYSLTQDTSASTTTYLIQSEIDLAFLSWTIYNDKVFGGSSNKVTISSYNYSLFYLGITFKQTKDLDLSDFYWQPIGIGLTRDGTSVRRYFSGNYDGGGCTVSGVFTPAGSSDGYSYQGLFGYVRGRSSTQQATITNVGVIDSFVQGSSNVGGVVGRADVSTITNCYNTGTVEGIANFVGGVVGDVANSSTITNCYNTGSVSGASDAVGGVAGFANGDVSNCYNTASVEGTGSYAGGIVGEAYIATITNCYNTGSVEGGNTVGGVVGRAYNNSTITNCYNTGSVRGSGNSVGGVVGYASSATITNCYNTGSVSGAGSLGGVLGGSSDCTLTNCYNTGTVDGYAHVGGVVGQGSLNSNLIIINCYNTGSVSSSSFYSIGGVVGNASRATITNNYYGGDCEASVGGINGADVDGQAEYLADLDVLAKNEEWYLDSSNWNSSHPWDFENVWAIYGETVNEGYPVFIRYWTDIYHTYENYVFSGAGSQFDPYLIETPQQLAYLTWTICFGSAHNGQSITINGENYYYQNSYFKQMANLDMSAGYWQPIGVFSTRESSEIVNRYFAGNYDGNGYIITGINIPEETEGSNQGLFGVIKGNITEASVTDVAIYNSNIHGLEYVGGVAGYVGENASVTDCFYQGGVYGSSSGGIVGQVDGGHVSSSGFEGEVSAGVSAIVGKMLAGEIDSCYAVAYTATTIPSEVMFGSIDGGVIQNCLSIYKNDTSESKNFVGSDFSQFIWINTNSSPIPKSLTWLGSIWPGSVTVDMLVGWKEIVI